MIINLEFKNLGRSVPHLTSTEKEQSHKVRKGAENSIPIFIQRTKTKYLFIFLKFMPKN